jgi:hypothetical protein
MAESSGLERSIWAVVGTGTRRYIGRIEDTRSEQLTLCPVYELIYFYNLHPDDARAYERLVKQAEEMQQQARAQKLGLVSAQEVPKVPHA